MTFAPGVRHVPDVSLVLKEAQMTINGRRASRGVLVALAVVLAWLVVLPRVFRRHRDALLEGGPFKSFLTRYNAVTRTISGTERSSWGLLTHVGRHSGRVYQTSLGAHPYRDGFLLPLGYGPRTDWYRNLMAAGGGTLAWKGRTYELERPELVSGSDAMHAWPIASRILLQLAGMHEFVWLHHRTEPATEPAPLTAQTQQAAR